MADEPKKEAPKLKGQAIIEDLKVKYSYLLNKINYK